MIASPLSEAEAQRYSRHLVLHEIGSEGQTRLKASSVLIVGIGGLGVSAGVQLASAGVGRIGILDDDMVEISNLQRQFIFSEADVGKSKVEVARRRLEVVNPNIRAAEHQGGGGEQDGLCLQDEAADLQGGGGDSKVAGEAPLQGDVHALQV